MVALAGCSGALPGDGAQRSGPFLLEAGEVDADGLQRSALSLGAADGEPGLGGLAVGDAAEPPKVFGIEYVCQVRELGVAHRGGMVH